MTQPLLIAFGVPIILLFTGAIGRKLVRKTAWQLGDFCLGVQLCLATISADLLFIFELLRSPVAESQARAINALIFLVVVVAIYIWQLAIHQDWDHDEADSGGRLVRLVLVANGLGIFLFAAFVFQIKGIQ